MSTRGSASYTTRSAEAPSSMPGRPSHSRAAQRPGGQGLDGRQPRSHEVGGLLGDQPVREAAARVGAEVDGHAGVVRRGHRRRNGGGAGPSCARSTRGTCPRPGAAISGSLAMLMRVGTMAIPCAANCGDRLRLEAAGVLDAVGPGRGEVVERLLAEAVRRRPGALLVGRGHRGDDGLAREATGTGRRCRGRSSRRPA